MTTLISQSQSLMSPLPPPGALAEANARVDAALDELREMEVALERQLAELQRYMKGSRIAGAEGAAPAVQ